jgi:hypothetical protein
MEDCRVGINWRFIGKISITVPFGKNQFSILHHRDSCAGYIVFCESCWNSSVKKSSTSVMVAGLAVVSVTKITSELARTGTHARHKQRIITAMLMQGILTPFDLRRE